MLAYVRLLGEAECIRHGPCTGTNGLMVYEFNNQKPNSTPAHALMQAFICPARV